MSIASLIDKHPNILKAKPKNTLGIKIEKQKEIHILPVYYQLSKKELDLIAKTHGLNKYEFKEKQQWGLDVNNKASFDHYVYVIKY